MLHFPSLWGSIDSARSTLSRALPGRPALSTSASDSFPGCKVLHPISSVYSLHFVHYPAQFAQFACVYIKTLHEEQQRMANCVGHWTRCSKYTHEIGCEVLQHGKQGRILPRKVQFGHLILGILERFLDT